VPNCRTERGVKRFDLVAMFASLWLLASMVIDAATPKELNVYMIGATLAPMAAISTALWWLRVPLLDFSVVFATLWMASVMVLEIITPKPMSLLMAAIAVVPLLIVGTVINFQRWRRSKGSATSTLSAKE
jgi:hypothetical protein